MASTHYKRENSRNVDTQRADFSASASSAALVPVDDRGAAGPLDQAGEVPGDVVAAGGARRKVSASAGPSEVVCDAGDP